MNCEPPTIPGGSSGGGENNNNDDGPSGGLQEGPGELLGGSGYENSDAATQYSYCGGGNNGWYNFFDCGANITQDLALLIETPFVGAETIAIGVGCFGGPKGCLAGAGLAQALYNLTGANAAETFLSTFLATGFSIFADVADDGHIGEGTVTAGTAAVVGFFSPDPIIDFIIDGYGAGYNHGVFNGIFSFFNSEPVVK
jgi:hypothetical protein